jgi:two-component system chemotaxis response regulator CheY
MRMLELADLLGSDQEGAGGSNAARRPRLLAIDDVTLHRMMICRVAAKAGYAPAGAASYGEAARLLRQAPFDCIILNLSAGAHDGRALLGHLSDIGCKTPIIIISGGDGVTCKESVQAAKSLDLNIWHSVPKPVDLVMLRYWLERLKSERPAAAAAA